MTWSDGFYVAHDYNALGRMTVVRENGVAWGSGVLATFAYDDPERRTRLVCGNDSTATAQLASMANNHAISGT